MGSCGIMVVGAISKSTYHHKPSLVLGRLVLPRLQGTGPGGWVFFFAYPVGCLWVNSCTQCRGGPCSGEKSIGPNAEIRKVGNAKGKKSIRLGQKCAVAFRKQKKYTLRGPGSLSLFKLLPCSPIFGNDLAEGKKHCTNETPVRAHQPSQWDFKHKRAW